MARRKEGELTGLPKGLYGKTVARWHPLATPEQRRQAQERFRKTILALEKKRRSKIFCLIHAGPRSHLCFDSLFWVVQNRKQFENLGTLELLLHSPGGHADVAYKLVSFFRRKCRTLNAIVPLEAKSAATLMCLGADSIHMGEFAELGPVDVQLSDPIERGPEPVSPLDEFKSMEFIADHAIEVMDLMCTVLEDRGMSVKEALEAAIPCVTGMMQPLYQAVDPIVMGEHRRSLAVGEVYAKNLLTLVGNPEAKRIVRELIWNYPSHDFVIDLRETMALKLPVVPLQKTHEDAILDALLEIIDYEMSFCGFVEQAAPTRATARRKIRRPRKRPVEAAPTDRKPVAVA